MAKVKNVKIKHVGVQDFLAKPLLQISHEKCFMPSFPLPSCTVSACLLRWLFDEKHLLQGFVDKYCNKFQSDGLQHLTAENIEKIYSNEMKSFYKFSFVRNPFSRVASTYCEIMKYRKDLRDFLVIYKDSSFNNFLKLIKKNNHTHWMPMVNFFSKDKIDFLGRFENFNYPWVYNIKLTISF